MLFENDVRPITVVVMLDTSASMDLNRRRLMAGAEQFLIRMLPFDRARVGAFNDKVEIEPAEFIGDRDELISWLPRLDFGNSTRVYDAAATALEALSTYLAGASCCSSRTATTRTATPAPATCSTAPSPTK